MSIALSSCGNSSVVEHLLAKERVAGSNPVSRFLRPHKIKANWNEIFLTEIFQFLPKSQRQTGTIIWNTLQKKIKTQLST
jgi:hypothetical protein